MPRLPSYRLHKPSGHAVVTICGRDFYMGKHNTKASRQAYDLLIKEWRATGKCTTFGVESSKITLAMLISDFRDWANSYYPMNGKDSEAAQIKTATSWLSDYLELPASQFGPLRLKAVRESMVQATGRHGKPLSRGYINDMIGRIVRMFQWGVENEIVTASVYQSLKAVRGLQAGRTIAPDHEPVEPVDDSIVEATCGLHPRSANRTCEGRSARLVRAAFHETAAVAVPA